MAKFAHRVAVDFEFESRPGERPAVVCCAYKIDDEPVVALWHDQLGALPPYPIGDDTVVVSFTQAEWSCHLALGWPLPANVIDLNCDLRYLTSGRKTPFGQGLVGFCRQLGVDVGDAVAKEAMQAIFIRGAPYSPDEKRRGMKYCGDDTDATARMFDRVEPLFSYPHALHRGEWSKTSAEMEHVGVPINGERFRKVSDPATWSRLRDALVPELDKAGIYVLHNDGTYHFSFDNLGDFLKAHGIPWVLTKEGRLSTTDKVFEDMTKGHPVLESLRQLRHIRDKMRTIDLAVGGDNRNRTVLWPFKAKTGRTQPAASKWSFSPAVWIRNLIEPGEGMAIAYVDYSSMEFLIAAAISGDPLMMKFYMSGDPYLSFPKHVGLVPTWATKTTHGELRDRYKVGLLAIQYGAWVTTLAAKLGVTEVEAHEMIRQHRQLFSTYWRWTEDWLSYSLDNGYMRSCVDWRCAVGEVELRTRSIINWPVQSIGGDILRMTCIWAAKKGLRLCAPVHDAILVEAPLDRIDRDVALLQDIMTRASRVVLGGPTLRTDAQVIRHPDHYSDKRGDEIWAIVTRFLEEDENDRAEPHEDDAGGDRGVGRRD
jgi:hypothetical protein